MVAAKRKTPSPKDLAHPTVLLGNSNMHEGAGDVLPAIFLGNIIAKIMSRLGVFNVRKNIVEDGVLFRMVGPCMPKRNYTTDFW